MPASREHVTLSIVGRDVAISNPSKVLFPEAGITKLDVVQYYLAVAEGALRGAGGRPNVLVRYANGIDEEFFYQKRAPTSRPPWIEVCTIAFPSGRTADEVVPRDARDAGLDGEPRHVSSCIRIRCATDDLDHPDELRVDLDPVPGVEWRQIVEVAGVVRDVLRDLDLVGWPKTSGSRGVHVIVRIERRWTFDEVRRAALALAREVERRAPRLATSKWWKEERHGVFVDYNQNAKDRTVASAYSVRPKPDARVSAPVTWEELESCRPEDFTLRTMPARFARLGDRTCRDRRASVLARPASGALAGAGSRAVWATRPGRRTTRSRWTSRRASSRHARGRATDPPRPGAGGARSRSSRSVAHAKKEDALAGLERWKARHPEAASHLAPARRAGRCDARPLHDLDARSA